MVGGMPEYHVTNVKALSSENCSNWLKSLVHKPSILTTKMNLIPINLIVNSYRPDIRDNFNIAFKDMIGDYLEYININKNDNINLMKATSRSHASAITNISTLITIAKIGLVIYDIKTPLLLGRNPKEFAQMLKLSLEKLIKNIPN